MSTLKGLDAEAVSKVHHVKPENVTLVDKAWMQEKGVQEHYLWQERAEWTPKEETVNSIMEVGVLQPVFIKKDGDAWLVEEGRQRYKALLEANRRLVEKGVEPWLLPVQINEGDDVESLVHMATLNRIRTDDDTLANAEGAAYLLQKNGGNRKQVATAYGVSLMTISNWLKLVQLSRAVKNAVRSGKISADAAVKTFKDVALADQPQKLQEVLAGAEDLAQKTAKPKAKAAPKPAKAKKDGETAEEPEAAAEETVEEPVKAKRVTAKVGTALAKGEAKPVLTRRQQVKRLVEHAESVPDKMRPLLQWTADVITDEEACAIYPWLAKALAE